MECRRGLSRSRVGFHAAMLQAGARRGQCWHGAQGTGASALNADGLPKHAAIAWPPWRLMEVRATNAIDIRQRSCPCTHSLALTPPYGLRRGRQPGSDSDQYNSNATCASQCLALWPSSTRLASYSPLGNRNGDVVGKSVLGSVSSC